MSVPEFFAVGMAVRHCFYVQSRVACGAAMYMSAIFKVQSTSIFMGAVFIAHLTLPIMINGR